MRIKKHIAVLRWAAILLSALWYLPSQAQTTDSLSHYLETAARYNPSVNSSFALYKASLESSPQRSDRDGTHGLRTIQGNPQQPVLRSQKPVVSIEQSE